MKTFAKFLTFNDHKPYAVIADLKTNRKGNATISCDIQYNPVVEHTKNKFKKKLIMALIPTILMILKHIKQKFQPVGWSYLKCGKDTKDENVQK